MIWINCEFVCITQDLRRELERRSFLVELLLNVNFGREVAIKGVSTPLAIRLAITLSLRSKVLCSTCLTYSVWF